MGAESTETSGPDLRTGVPVERLEDGRPLAGHVDGEPVVVTRSGGDIHALGAICTHWGGPLADGLVVDDTIRCPWHHACFSLRTGEALGPPALDPVARWTVDIHDGIVRVTGKDESTPTGRVDRRPDDPQSIVIIGAGAAGSAAAEMLLREGYEGAITLVDPDDAAPYDRPNLSKDYLAGKAPSEWVPLRADGYYAERGIERVAARATTLDTAERTVSLDDGRSLIYDALLLATGADPVRPTCPGGGHERVHVLRSLADCEAIIAAADRARRAVVLGASFIAMETAAALRARGLEVTVVAPEAVPFERTLGEELGGTILALHRDHGVEFRLGRVAEAVTDEAVRLDSGEEIAAELVVAGIGVRPDVSWVEDAGIEVDDGVLVDSFLATSEPGVYTAGDIARFPDPRTGDRARIEHWAVAQRQGRTAARNILGAREPYTAPPFFWTQHWDLTLAYVGHAPDWDGVRIEGDPAERDCAVVFVRDGRELAMATIERDRESLRAEAAMAEAGANGFRSGTTSGIGSSADRAAYRAGRSQ